MADWHAWHEDYADPDSALSHRRAAIQRCVRERLDRGPTRLLSLCAGDGTDVLGVLRPGDDVRGRLVELDPVLAGRARALAPATIEVITGDAGTTDACVGAVPADLLLLCGIFGNIADADILRTVQALPLLCATGATVVWTRGRKHVWNDDRDITGMIRGWFADVGCAEETWIAPDGETWSVGVHRFDGEPQPLVPGQRMFTFVR